MLGLWIAVTSFLCGTTSVLSIPIGIIVEALGFGERLGDVDKRGG